MVVAKIKFLIFNIQYSISNFFSSIKKTHILYSLLLSSNEIKWRSNFVPATKKNLEKNQYILMVDLWNLII